jgi:hypothetical protein
VQPSGHGRGEQRARHSRGAGLGIRTARCGRATPGLLSRKILFTEVRCRYQCSAAADCCAPCPGWINPGSSGRTSRRRQQAAAPARERQSALVRVQRPAAP